MLPPRSRRTATLPWCSSLMLSTHVPHSLRTSRAYCRYVDDMPPEAKAGVKVNDAARMLGLERLLNHYCALSQGAAGAQRLGGYNCHYFTAGHRLLLWRHILHGIRLKARFLPSSQRQLAFHCKRSVLARDASISVQSTVSPFLIPRRPSFPSRTGFPQPHQLASFLRREKPGADAATKDEGGQHRHDRDNPEKFERAVTSVGRKTKPPFNEIHRRLPDVPKVASALDHVQREIACADYHACQLQPPTYATPAAAMALSSSAI